MDCSLPGSSVHVILKARILEWVAISFSNSRQCYAVIKCSINISYYLKKDYFPLINCINLMLQKYEPYLSCGFRESGWGHTADLHITELLSHQGNHSVVLLGETELQQLSLVPHHRGAETCISHFSSLNVAISAHSHLHSLKYVDLDDGCPSKDST